MSDETWCSRAHGLARAIIAGFVGHPMAWVHTENGPRVRRTAVIEHVRSNGWAGFDDNDLETVTQGMGIPWA